MERYKIWIGDGTMMDGAEYETLEEAKAGLLDWLGFDDLFIAEHCDGEAWSVYEDESDAAVDVDGVYPTTITRVK
jgi:hypothetical protein